MRSQRSVLVAIVAVCLLSVSTGFAALLGVLPGFPMMTYDSTGTVVYTSLSQSFVLNASPIAIRFTNSSPPRFVNPTGFPPSEVVRINILVNNTGGLISGVPGDDLIIQGEVDADGNGSIDYSGTLLTGEILAFGFLESGATDQYDFRFALTGGSLAPFFTGKDIGVTTSSEASNFGGVFTVNFNGGAKGTVGPIDRVNRGPNCELNGPYMAECQGGTTSISVSAAGSSDPDGDPLTFTWTTDCPNSSFASNGGSTNTLTIDTSISCNIQCSVSVTVSDGINPPVTCTATVQITDATIPSVSCPGDVTVQCGSDTSSAATGRATASDSCDPAPVVTHSDYAAAANCPQASTITRTWTATDRCGNSASCAQTISVVDTTPPTITCPANIDVYHILATDPSVTGTATASDNCDPAPAVTHVDDVNAQNCPNNTIITRTWTATDACGNHSSCVQIITVHPSQNCPPPGCTRYKLKNGTGCQPDAPPSYGLRVDELYDVTCYRDIFTFDFNHPQSKVWADVCGCTIHIFGQVYGGLDTGYKYGNSSYRGVYLIDFTYTLSCCSGSCLKSTQSTGSVCGTIKPSFGSNQSAKTVCNYNNCGSSFELCNAACTCSGGRVGSGLLKYTGNACDVKRFWDFLACPTTECFCEGSPATIPPPEINCPANKTVACDASTDPADTGTATAMDSCTHDPEITYSDVATSPTCPKVITRTWTATDECGHSRSCTQIITVLGPSHDVCMVVPNTNCLTGQEAIKKSKLQSWGWTVRLLNECASPAAFKVAAANNDVIYITENVMSSNVTGKLNQLAVGIVSEEPFIMDELKFQATDGPTYSGSSINVVDNAHYITNGLPLGSVAVYSSAGELIAGSATLGAGVQTLAKKVGGSSPTLVAIETGGALIDGSQARGRRVTLPWGGDGFNFNNLTSAGKGIFQRAMEWAASGTVLPLPASQLLFVVEGHMALGAGDAARRSLMESWGWEVTYMDSDDSSSTFSAAAALSKVVYVTENVTSSNINTKLTNVARGVVSEEPFILDDLKLQGSNAATITGRSSIKIVNNSHYITQGMAMGTLTITTAGTELIEAAVTMSAGTVGLATKTDSSNKTLVAIDAGGALSGGGNAAARRVGLPWGGEAFDFSKLNTNGKTLMKRAIEWAGQ